MTTEFVTADDGVALAFERTGVPGGAPVMLVHGFGSSRSQNWKSTGWVSTLTEAGFDIIEEQQPSFLFGRSVLITGEVARTTGYEPGFPPQQAWLGGRWQPDPLVLDDQALIINVQDRGLVVITGCGHAGVVNIARYAQRLTGDQPLYPAFPRHELTACHACTFLRAARDVRSVKLTGGRWSNP